MLDTLNGVKVGDTLRIHKAPFGSRTSKVVRVTKTFVQTECGSRFKVKDGSSGGLSHAVIEVPKTN